MKFAALFCLTSLSGVAAIATAQYGAITGRVQTADKGMPLLGANVILLGSHLGATADPNGFYIITNVPPGTYHQNKAASQPYAHFDLELLSSPRFGPKLFGEKLFSNWRVNLLGEWRAGKVFTWSGPIVDQDMSTFGIQYSPHPTLQNNVRTRDFYRLDLRLSKLIKTQFGSMQLFVDVSNLLNLKFMYFERPFLTLEGNPFADYNAYMTSLHLPRDAFNNLDADEIPYFFIPGNDRPGDFRKAGVAFVPIHIIRNQRLLPPIPPASGTGVELYYIHDTATYVQFVDGVWQHANPELVRQVLADRAYINMPDKNNQTFLNPRSVSIGIRFSFKSKENL